MPYISNDILIKFLKKHNVHKLVLSSGTRNIPFVSSVEVDDWFECFSVVDERNAAFFGMGLAQQTNEPVVIACTSGTAVSNYVTGITEAFYSHVPLIAITFDRSPYVLDQLETQKIDQMSIFSSITKANVELPMIKDDEDIWYCERLLNEAFISMHQHGTGPIHINIPLVGSTNELWEKQNKKEDTIKYIEYYSYETNNWEEISDELGDKRILFVIGQNTTMTSQEKERLNEIIYKLNAVVLNDNLTNFKSRNSVNPEIIIKALDGNSIIPYLPDIVITYGANFQERIKDLLKANERKFEHWLITEDGKVKDCFRSQTKLFECSISYFVDRISDTVRHANGEYLRLWKKLNDCLAVRDLPFSNFSVVRDFSVAIPENSILHLSILNATRLMQFFDLSESITVYSNANSFGIDGCLPTFLGQAYAFDGPAFIVIGDLAFFYAMNAMGIKHIKNNVHVLLINNGGGAEFHIVPSHNELATIDLHIGASHHQNAEGWIKSLGFEYIAANNSEDFKTKLKQFVDTRDKPIVLEVFTDLETDGQTVLETYRDLEKQLGEIK